VDKILLYVINKEESVNCSYRLHISRMFRNILGYILSVVDALGYCVSFPGIIIILIGHTRPVLLKVGDSAPSHLMGRWQKIIILFTINELFFHILISE